MTKDVIISLTGFQYLQGEAGAIPLEVVTRGEYYLKDGKHYVLFEEMTEGFRERTNSMLKFNPSRLLVHKRGLINTEMIFEAGKRTSAAYTTPFGIMEMGITATSFHLKVEEDSIDYEVNYALSVNDSFVADCQILLNVRSPEAGNFRLES